MRTFAAGLLLTALACGSAAAQQTADRLPIIVPAEFSSLPLYATCAAKIDNPGTMDGTLRIVRCFIDERDGRSAKRLALYLKNLRVTSDGRKFSLDADGVKLVDSLIASADYIASIGAQDTSKPPAPEPTAVPTETARPKLTAASTVATHPEAARPEPARAETPAGLPAGVENVFVPRGTVIVVALDNAITSYSAASREPLSYTVVQDVIVNGHVIAKAGDEATGIVLEAQQGNEGGLYGIGWKAANLRVDVEKVNNFCGDAVSTRFIRSEYRRRQGLFGSHQDLEIIKGQKYIAQTAHAQKICGEATSATPLPIPADALGPDN